MKNLKEINADVIVAGAGFSGAAAARTLAEKGYRVVILEQRKTVGGNAYDYDDRGILAHMYGPHIFHTNYDAVYDFLSRFTGWFDYKHKVLGSIDGKLVPIPFNFSGLDMLFRPKEAAIIKKALLAEYGENKKIPILELKNKYNKNPLMVKFADYVYEKVFHNYTLKQWGMPPEALGAGVMNRVPVVASYESGYFADKYQCMPVNGFTALITAMLDHPLIDVRLNTKFDEVVTLGDGMPFLNGKPFAGRIIYTGCIDELFGYKYGKLPYRSLKFKFEHLDNGNFQPAAVVNYPNTKKYTRITEFSKFTCKPQEKYSVVVKEYPMAHEEGMIPYYPVEIPENKELYKRYEDEVNKIRGFFLLGRLANYKYINMDAAVLNALELVRDNF